MKNEWLHFRELAPAQGQLVLVGFGQSGGIICLGIGYYNFIEKPPYEPFPVFSKDRMYKSLHDGWHIGCYHWMPDPSVEYTGVIKILTRLYRIRAAIRRLRTALRECISILKGV